MARVMRQVIVVVALVCLIAATGVLGHGHRHGRKRSVPERYEVVVPIQVSPQLPLAARSEGRAVFTRSLTDSVDDYVADHAHEAVVEFNAFGRSLRLLLDRDDSLFHKNYASWELDGATGERRRIVTERCVYSGRVEGDAQSVVRVSTCNGVVAGSIVTSDEEYYIEPGDRFFADALPEDMRPGEHVVYRRSDMSKSEGRCGVESSGRTLPEDLDAAVNAVRKQSARSDGDIWTEVLFVSDKSMYERFSNSSPDVESYAVLLMSLVRDMYLRGDLFSKRINIVLKHHVVITTTNPFTVVSNPSTTLSNFASWQSQSTQRTAYAHDNAVLLTHVDFDGSTIGLAYVGSMCSTSTTANINQNTGYVSTAMTIAHEMGHNFGAEHDSSGNACHQSNYIMAAISGSNLSPPTFSSCSASYFNTHIGKTSVTCLNNNPGAGLTLPEPYATYPGLDVTREQQCQMAYSRPACNNAAVICKMFCSTGGGGCSGNDVPMLDGTDCGSGKWCINGACVTKPAVVPTGTPTTQAPTTQAPTTQAPTTQAPTTTLAPTTQAPTATVPPPVTGGGNPTTTAEGAGDAGNDNNSNDNVGVIVGVIIAVLIIVALAIAAFFLVRRGGWEALDPRTYMSSSSSSSSSSAAKKSPSGKTAPAPKPPTSTSTSQRPPAPIAPQAQQQRPPAPVAPTAQRSARTLPTPPSAAAAAAAAPVAPPPKPSPMPKPAATPLPPSKPAPMPKPAAVPLPPSKPAAPPPKPAAAIPTAKAQYHYSPAQPDEIALAPGDVVRVETRRPDGWAMGTNMTTGQRGLFPANYIA